MPDRLCVLVALPRPIVTLLAEEDGEIVTAAGWDRARGATAVPPLRETPVLDAVYDALRGRPTRLTLLRHATIEALQDALLRERPHLFVLDTHGEKDGTLLLEGPCSETNLLPAAELGAMLARRGVRLALLSACHSAVAAEAVRAAGVPVVIGMAESIYEDAAAAYLSAFLGALAGGDSPHDAHRDGLARLRLRFDRREGEAGLPRLLAADYAAVQPLVAGSSGDFEDATRPLPQPAPSRPVARLFGRELDQVLAQRFLLQGDGRLATLTGMGGIGKTALARAVGWWAWGRNLFPGGVYFASLENLTLGETVAVRLAARLGLLPGEGRTPEETLAPALGGSASALLVADNCETAGPGAGLEVLTDLRRRCPRLRVLATGRRSLGLTGETVYELKPLALAGAVKMFLDRAGRPEPEEDTELLAIMAICRRLDRVPLHVLLVASHRATPAEILAGLDDSASAHRLTAADRPDLPERQRSRLLSFFYTWDRLRPAGQKTWAVFAAVLANGADVAALRAVVGETFDAVAGLEELVNWHALEQWEAAGRSCYRMLATTAEFGRARAAELETLRQAQGRPGLDLPALSRRQAEHYLAYARRHQDEFDLLHAALDNIRLGWATAVASETRDDEMVRDYIRAMDTFLDRQGFWDEDRRWWKEYGRASENLGDKAGLAASYSNIASVHYARGDYGAALEWYERSVALKEELGDKAGLAASYNNIG